MIWNDKFIKKKKKCNRSIFINYLRLLDPSAPQNITFFNKHFFILHISLFFFSTALARTHDLAIGFACADSQELHVQSVTCCDCREICSAESHHSELYHPWLTHSSAYTHFYSTAISVCVCVRERDAWCWVTAVKGWVTTGRIILHPSCHHNRTDQYLTALKCATISCFPFLSISIHLCIVLCLDLSLQSTWQCFLSIRFYRQNKMAFPIRVCAATNQYFRGGESLYFLIFKIKK